MYSFRKKNLIYFAVAATCLLFLSSLIPATRQVSLTILQFPLKALSWVGREVNGLFFFHRNMVQNEMLQERVAVLQKQLIDTNETYLENRRLQNLVSFKQKSPYKVIAARLIGTSPDSWSSTVIIDRGEKSGIRRGYVVISHLGLVGRVVETQAFTSKVMLLTDPAISVSAIVQRSRQEGLVSGTLGNTLIMRYLPIDADININDTIISSGLTEAYPKGLLIGTVIEIGNEFSGLSRFATVKPAVTLSDLEEVLIIIP